MGNNLEFLVASISETAGYFKSQAQKQVNIALTVRNWFIGFYIVEYEQNGLDRAEYGSKLYKEIAGKLKNKGEVQIRERHLYLCKDFYVCYPNILRTPSAKLYLSDLQRLGILRSLSAKLEMAGGPIQQKPSVELGRQATPTPVLGQLETDVNLLINRLSFSHIIELLKAGEPVKRMFYETEAIKNNWSVRDLKRAMNSMLFERTGLSTNKEEVIKKHIAGNKIIPEDVFRNPYILEFLGLPEKAEYTETDLEQAIINHLQNFLLEMGRGFCFEARQKRITFDNTHYRIDLVFYHRILKCHVLIDLKLGEFTHADAGQMNVYLNYFKENENADGDNAPVGIILCASKNENLARYATVGLPQQVFVSKYMINLPSEAELIQIIKEEQEKIAK